MKSRVPCIVFEDDHLLVLDKPAGINTHAAHPHQSEGIHEWLANREADWAHLAIVHRLDKGTSGLLLFAKTAAASRSLVRQFAQRTVRKKYLLLTNQSVSADSWRARSILVRAGEKYWSRPGGTTGDAAVTVFRKVGAAERGWLWEARPETGRTHQIRVHAADHGIPILGDSLYGGAPAPRLCLHCEELELRHPATEETLQFHSPARFQTDRSIELRSSLIAPEETDAYRLIHGASDGHPGWFVDRVGAFLLSQASAELAPDQSARLAELVQKLGLRGAVHRVESSSRAVNLVWGEPWPERFAIQENRVRFEVRNGSTLGFFLDQRDNRRRLLTAQVAAGFALVASARSPLEVLNLFAHTCSFSVCAARAGGQTTSVDLSRPYLDWGKRNFELNDLDPADHQFLTGDAFDWLARFRKKGRQFDVIIADPPTFSRSKTSGTFAVERDLGKLAAAAVPLVRPGGILFASCNTARLEPKVFVETVRKAVASSQRELLQEHYAPQPPDFPITREEPGYLKTIWLQLG